MKKIIFLALGFPNVENSTTIWTDLIGEFSQQGHDVLVVAPALKNKEVGVKIEGGIKVLRVSTLELFNTGKFKKGIANVLLPYQYKNALRKNKIELDFDLILMPTPPITLTNVAKWLKKKSKTKMYLILRDIFPQNAVDLKMMAPNSLTYTYFRKKEIEMYQVSDAIGCMSNANVSYVKKHNPQLDQSKLHLLPNWENAQSPTASADNENIKEQYGLKNKFVLIFGGNIGKPQKMENIIELAKSCLSIDDIVFIIIGEGTEKKKIENLASQYNLNNVILKDKIPRSEYNELLRIADVGLISLSEDFTIPNFPSKVLSYFNLKKPILASIDLSTDFGDMLEDTNSGFWAEAGKTDLLKEKLMTLYRDKDLRLQMGLNGYNYKNKYLLPEHAYSTIISHVNEK
ncbi:glycosyltransferase family 4 protein [Arenibacter sp. ARW7G5Y1]|uniref:glycosyltransferase family 4 protein n=1 Tax=Arenibacter sp. ARW7G5Y1 TaxID=2135619 RepID=UPI000D760C83|nr:glycosyltransferase family 4 protein [Arenibacter sp. ARW7G5Y1]PXX28374.1 glycosyltransferase involved in cell wall biosynthesis [Arenibacter sp. ARW7G5Y1]